MNEQVEHVVSLPAHLQPDLYPVQAGGLEELCGLEGPEQVPLPLRFGRTVVQRVQHVVLQQLLVAHSHLQKKGVPHLRVYFELNNQAFYAFGRNSFPSNRGNSFPKPCVKLVS